jgi:hypothetical protein
MFITLLGVTFFIALAVAGTVTWLFHHSLRAILNRILTDQISQAWLRYLQFAIYVVGISSGVRIWELEKYITPHQRNEQALVLNTERWVLEVYRTIVGTLQGVAWLLLVFFVFALVAYVAVRIFESRTATAR